MIAAAIKHARPRMRHTIAHARRAPAAVALAWLVATAAPAAAQPDVRAAPDDPFARRGWHLELAGQGALETWNYNISHEELFGFTVGVTYGLGNGIVITAGSPLYYVSQRGVDGYLFGATVGIRGRIYRRGRVSVFLEGDLGVSEADTFVPPRGTRFNYLARGGAGTTFRVRRGLHVIAGLALVHISNNGLAGRHRNPDIEAVGPRAGILIGF
jgi:hypothetical protein